MDDLNAESQDHCYGLLLFEIFRSFRIRKSKVIIENRNDEFIGIHLFFQKVIAW